MPINKIYSPTIVRKDINARDVVSALFFHEPKKLAAVLLQLEQQVNTRWDKSNAVKWPEQCKAAAGELSDGDRKRVAGIMRTLTDAMETGE